MFKTLLSILYLINLALVVEFKWKILNFLFKKTQFLSPKKNELDKNLNELHYHK